MRWRYAQRFLHGFGEWWLAQGDPHRALALAEECLAWAERSASNKNIVKAKRLRGQACLMQGRVEEAEKDIAAALGLAEVVGSPAPDLEHARAWATSGGHRSDPKTPDTTTELRSASSNRLRRSSPTKTCVPRSSPPVICSS